MSDYFTKNTDRAIEKFNTTQEIREKHAIFNTDIKPAFEKLIESLIYVYGFQNLDDDPRTLKDECLANLYEMLPKFDPNRGTKGFSYFNVVAKNWFIQKAKEKKKKNTQESELYCDLDHETVKNDPNSIIESIETEIEKTQWWEQFHKQLDLWSKECTKPGEKKVLEAVVFLLKNPDSAPIYNKKAVYFFLRELSSLNTKQVMVNLKKFKTWYEEWKEDYEEGVEED